MKKFVFRFESILKMHMDREVEIGGELAALMNELAIMDQSMRVLEKKNEALSKEIDQKKEFGTSVYEICRADEGRRYFKIQMLSLEERRCAQIDKIASKRMELTDAMKRRKIMEKLKEKAHDEYVEEFEREERRIIEEIVTYKGSVKSE